MAPQSFSIPLGSWVLVTGANGYIASHVVNVLLDLGFNVRGTVRTSKPWLDQFFEAKYGKGRFESVVVPVIEEEDALDAAMEGISGVVHMASDVSLSSDPNKVIPNVQHGTVNALAAAAKQKSVKRFVLTSSSSAAIIPKPNKVGVTIDESSWNDEAVSLAWSDKVPEADKGYIVYAASKTEGERTAWKWVAEEKPSFVFNAILPNCNFGKLLIPDKIPGSTMGIVRNFFKGDYTGFQLFPPQYYVDVEDCARLHVAALLDDSVNSQRIFAFAGAYNWTDVISILRKLRPNRELLNAPENEGRDFTVVTPREKAEGLLRSFFGQAGWTSLEDSLAKGIEDIP